MCKKQIIIGITAIISILLLVAIVQAQSTERLMNSGNHLLVDGAYYQAIPKFRKVIARDPNNFEAQFNLAIAYLFQEQYLDAVREFKKAAYLNPRSAETWSDLAFAYNKLGWSQKALNALYIAVRSDLNNVTARINLATVYAQKKRYDQAIAQYKQVIQIDGTNYDAYVNLAKCLISKNRLKEAEHYLKSAIAIDPNESEAYWVLGNVLWDSKRNSKGAIENYRKSIALNPNSQTHYENLGLLLEELWKENRDENKRREAINVWNQGLIYLDDAIKREYIQARIKMLERGELLSGETIPEELFGRTEADKSDTKALQTEMRKEAGEEAAKVKLIKVGKYDVKSDLNDLGKKEDNQFEFDMKKAVEEKKKERKREERLLVP